MNPIQNSFGFLVENIIGLYMILVVLRFLLALVKADFRNPLMEPIVRLTQPPLAWLRRFVPGLFGVDLSALVLLLLLACLKIVLLALINGSGFAFGGVLLSAIAQCLNITLWVFTIALIAQAVLSWFASSAHHPVVGLLHDLTAPILRPIQRMMPSAAGLDFSPIVALIGLSFLRRLIVDPMLYSAAGLL